MSCMPSLPWPLLRPSTLEVVRLFIPTFRLRKWRLRTLQPHLFPSVSVEETHSGAREIKPHVRITLTWWTTLLIFSSSRQLFYPEVERGRASLNWPSSQRYYRLLEVGKFLYRLCCVSYSDSGKEKAERWFL